MLFTLFSVESERSSIGFNVYRIFQYGFCTSIYRSSYQSLPVDRQGSYFENIILLIKARHESSGGRKVKGLYYSAGKALGRSKNPVSMMIYKLNR